MNLFGWLQSLLAAPDLKLTTSGKQSPQAGTSSLHGRSASQITSELARRGSGDMATGVTRTAQKAFWQGRIIQRNIDNRSGR